MANKFETAVAAIDECVETIMNAIDLGTSYQDILNSFPTAVEKHAFISFVEIVAPGEPDIEYWAQGC